MSHTTCLSIVTSDSGLYLYEPSHRWEHYSIYDLALDMHQTAVRDISVSTNVLTSAYPKIPGFSRSMLWSRYNIAESRLTLVGPTNRARRCRMPSICLEKRLALPRVVSLQMWAAYVRRSPVDQLHRKPYSPSLMRSLPSRYTRSLLSSTHSIFLRTMDVILFLVSSNFMYFDF